MLLRLLGRHLHGRRAALVGVLVAQVLMAAALLYQPRLAAEVVDGGVARGDVTAILASGRLMLLAGVGQIACLVAVLLLSTRIATGIGRDVRLAVFRRVAAFSGTEVSGFGVPTLVTRTVNDVQQVQQVTLLGLGVLVAAPITCAGGVVMAVREDARLSAVLLVSVPVLVVAVLAITRRMVVHYGRVQGGVDGVNRLLREHLGGIRVVRAFGREGHESGRFAVADRGLTGSATLAGRWYALLSPSLMVVLNLSAVAVVWLGGIRADAGGIGAGAVVALVAYFAQILAAVLNAGSLAVLGPRAEVSAGRVLEVLGTEPSVRPPVRPVATPARRGRLELAGVEFRFPGADLRVLGGVSFVAEPGHRVAVVGGTGAGKSTLLSLVPRLSDVTGGRVLIDGVDVRDLEPDELRARVALVPQRPFLFTGTVATNLRLGRPAATDGELWDALEVAQARGFVEALPERLDAPVGSGGAGFSGGQRQRLSVARALVSRPDIYLLDDAFSALDPATEARLRLALRRRTADATVVTVAQRVASVAGADRVVVLDDGVVAGTGTHEELLRGSPVYRELVASQLDAEDVA